MSTNYVYQALGDDHTIRIVELHPSPSVQDEVYCSIHHVLLEDGRDMYTALSYVWGDASDVTSVTVDTSSLCITKTLDRALQHIRGAESVVYVWADGICINQYNNAEKAHQVLLMGEIYSTARNTIIFLGPAEANSEEVMTKLSRFTNSDDYEDMLDEPVLIQGLRTVFQNPWFSRVWILQELVLSREPVIMWGCDRLSWNTLSGIAKWVTHNRDFQELFDALLDAGENPDKVKDWFGSSVVESMQAAKDSYDTTKRQKHNSPKLMKCVDIILSQQLGQEMELRRLLDLIVSRTGLGASDPRDLVYAHLGLTDKAGIEVDYKQPIAAVYHDFAMRVIQSSGNLRLLGYIAHTDFDARRIVTASSSGRAIQTQELLASWAPNWTIPRQISPYSIMEHVGYDFNHISSTSPDNRFAEIRTHGNSILWVNGNLVGHIQHLGPVLDNVKIRPQLEMPPDDPWPDNPDRQWLDDIPGITKPIGDIMWRNYLNHRDPTASCHRFCTSQHLIDYVRRRRFITYTKNIIDGRRMAILEGQRLALVPCSTNEGDSIYFMANCPVPFVLQDATESSDRDIVDIGQHTENPHLFMSDYKDAKRMKLVGESFVEDAMYGEHFEHRTLFTDVPIALL